MSTSHQNQKLSLYNQLLKLLQKEIEEGEMEIASIKDSRNNDTKSSAGDKFETGRSMMQMEMDKLESQLDKRNRMKNDLEGIKVHQITKSIALGSLVFTDQENYFLTIAFGKVITPEITAYSISLASPVGKALLGKKANDEITVNGRKINIVDFV